jgi:hypothetical protein
MQKYEPSPQQAAGIEYPGPHYALGLVQLGVDAEGTWHDVQLAVPTNGARHGVVCGDRAGAGSTTILEQLGLAARASARWQVLYCYRRVASPILSEFATSTVDHWDGAWAQLEGLEALVDLRTSDGVDTSLVPGVTSEDPGVLWIIEDFDRISRDHRLASRIVDLAREGALANVAVWVATPTLDLVDFAGIRALRTLLCASNLIALSSNDDVAGAARPGLDPRGLPHEPGYALLCRPDRGSTVVRSPNGDLRPWVRTLPAIEPREAVRACLSDLA